MLRRISIFLLLGLLALCAACTNKKVSNPLANVGSKQPDKVLFDRAMDDMKHNHFDSARLDMQTLINAYPDSEYIARAKLAVADSWYAEGGSASLAQAEAEYEDFETFFPNMPEAAEAQLKIANIHFKQMEKPDRDYTHAVRAEEEYRKLILQWPGSKLVPEAKVRLLQVQEVIGEREFRVGHFYYARQSYPAAIARLQSLVDEYPLYSKADEALYLLGQSYEGEISVLRGRPGNEVMKARMIEDFTKHAAEAYSRILTRYPLMNSADDAKQRLEALKQPVPRPTRAAVALNKAEEDSRHEENPLSKVIGTFGKSPDTSEATKVGDPSLVEPKVTSAKDVVQEASRAAGGDAGKESASVETVKGTEPPTDQPAPRSDSPLDNGAVVNGKPEDNSGVDTTAAQTPQTDLNELKPNAAPDPNELKPNVPADNGQPATPPPQVNEINQPGADTATASDGKPDDASAPADDSYISSSKKKKKKGLHKVIPY
ncbi:MAG: outer membrane protein assembly factor BamD [Terriglobales bacterium]